jgi:tyrosyl-tRNA synthetase
MTDPLLDELAWRGLLHEVTPGLSHRLSAGPLHGYAGFDPTARSLQIGNLIVVMLLVHLQRFGHHPVVVVGDGTALIGDPSGRSEERPLLSRAEVEEHAENQRQQLSPFLDESGPNALRVCHNSSWLGGLPLIDFLRDVGKHFTINVMLQKEAVKARLETGISYTEFSYMLLQAYDYLHLYRSEGCELQVGGSDQWGNITAGTDLIRRVTGAGAHGLCAPLVTTPHGRKFGKTAGGAVWLDPELTTPYQFLQFWMNVDDRDVETHLRRFTLLDAETISDLARRAAEAPAERAAQRALARDVTARVHGDAAAQRVEEAAAVLFGGFDPRRARAGVFGDLARELPTAPASEEATLVELLVAAQLVSSKGEARRAIAQGGVYLNQQRVEADRRLEVSDWLEGGYVLLRRGAKHYALAHEVRS